MPNSRLVFTQVIIFAIEIMRLAMNVIFIWHAMYWVIHGEESMLVDIRLDCAFELTLVISQFCSIVFAFNQCAHLMKLILQL